MSSDLHVHSAIYTFFEIRTYFEGRKFFDKTDMISFLRKMNSSEDIKAWMSQSLVKMAGIE